MKLLKIFLLTMFMTVSAHAETITVIVTGKPGGTFHARSMLYVEELTKLGWDTNIIQAGSCVKAQTRTCSLIGCIVQWPFVDWTRISLIFRRLDAVFADFSIIGNSFGDFR